MRRRRLGINLDHIVGLRHARRTPYPEPTYAAAVAQDAGASHITAHLREDRRHVQERDVRLLRQTLHVPFNLAMAASAEMAKFALDVKPDQVTLVAEHRDEFTTEGGLDVSNGRDHLKRSCHDLQDADIEVSVFIDPDLDQVRAAHRINVHMVELHTGKYADARTDKERRVELLRIADAARAANKLGMRVSAGHGLHFHNIQDLVPIDEIEAYNVGHGVVARAVFTGLYRAVADMLALLR